MKGDRLEQCDECGLFAHIAMYSETMGDLCQECLDRMVEAKRLSECGAADKKGGA